MPNTAIHLSRHRQKACYTHNTLRPGDRERSRDQRKADSHAVLTSGRQNAKVV